MSKNFLTLFFIFLTLFINNVLHAEKKEPPEEKTPLKIVSDKADFDDKTGIATYTGKVIATEGEKRIEGNQLKIYRGKNNKIEKMVATGTPAIFTLPPEINKPFIKGHALQIDYIVEDSTVILSKEAEISQNKDSIVGEKIIYNLKTKMLRSEPVPNKRTTVIIHPNS